jgi:hypothetical protein
MHKNKSTHPIFDQYGVSYPIFAFFRLHIDQIWGSIDQIWGETSVPRYGEPCRRLTPNRKANMGILVFLCMKQEVENMKRNEKATKNDDAPVPEYIWNDAIVPDGDSEKISLDKIRQFALRWWKKHATRDFLRWFRAKHSKASPQSDDWRRDLSASREFIS